MIKDFLIKEGDSSRVSFHMPGHKGGRLYEETGHGDFTSHFMDFDITEIPGADNLHDPQDIIKQVMDGYSELYGSLETYLLVGGSTCGLEAAVMATVSPGEKLLMARNCHKAVYSALVLGDVEPVFMSATDDPDELYDNVEEALIEHTDIKAMILPRPDYYGRCVDLDEVAELLHEHGAVLLVDQAHGAHLPLFRGMIDLPEPAELQGADIIVESTHKTLASMTQTAILNLMSERVDKERLEAKLRLVQSTSPSYILMASLDINLQILQDEGVSLLRRWAKGLDYVYDSLEDVEGVELLCSDSFDRTKINISIAGMTGSEIAQALYDRDIVVELFSGELAMCMTGIGNTMSDYEALVSAVLDIAEQVDTSSIGDANEELDESSVWIEEVPEPGKRYPEKVLTGLLTEEIEITKSVGKVSAVDIIPYPPGIPWVVRGEVISKEIAAGLADLLEADRAVNGVHEGKVFVFEDDAIKG